METRPNDDARTQQPQLPDQEMSAIRRGPLAAAKLIIEASPSVGPQLFEEKAVAIASIGGTTTASDVGSIIGLAFQAPLTDDERNILDSDASKDELFEVLNQAITVVKSKAPGEAAAYCKLIVEVAASVATAARECGRRGAGPIVSEREDMMLAEIRRMVCA